ncbi:Vacuolar ATP synthase subunit C [Collariella sp. IMI 366227]|nr:Vacuolar ATP synthase subunit C [Collariella sp. IMI 366227]
MSQYSLVSLPLRIFDDDPMTALAATVGRDNGETLPFPIPAFKIGTLDSLVQHADDLAKLSAACEASAAKVADSLKGILDGDEDKVAQQKIVNDKPTDHYLRNFQWNKVRYRADRPLGELIANLQKDLQNTDTDVKSKFNQYNSIKTKYLETHLIVVPTNARKDFLRSYETLAPMVVPRSSIQVAQDDEFTLFAVTTFKKTSAEFLQKCREQKWTPRQYKYVEGGKEEEQRELDRVAREEKKVWGEALRLGRMGWSETVVIWTHVMTLRVFVETVLRYGLPLEFVCALIKTTPKLAKKVKTALDSSYSYLGGNAFGRDKKGRVTKDDAALTSEMAAAGLGGEGSEYTAYVYYEIELP